MQSIYSDGERAAGKSRMRRNKKEGEEELRSRTSRRSWVAEEQDEDVLSRRTATFMCTHVYVRVHVCAQGGGHGTHVLRSLVVQQGSQPVGRARCNHTSTFSSFGVELFSSYACVHQHSYFSPVQHDLFTSSFT